MKTALRLREYETVLPPAEIYALVALMILGSAGADCRSALSGPRWSNARRLRWAVVWICAVYVAIAFQETLVDLLKRSHLDVTEGQLAFVLFYWPLAQISAWWLSADMYSERHCAAAWYASGSAPSVSSFASTFSRIERTAVW